MKKYLPLLFLFFIIQLAFSQDDYYKEFDYNKFVGTFYHTGGDGLKIEYRGNYFKLTDLSMGEVVATFKGYPDNGRIKYKSGNNTKYISFSKDYENVLIYIWKKELVKVKEEKIPRKKSLTLSDINAINKFTGYWVGKNYPGSIYECKIYISNNNKLIYKDILNKASCELSLINGNKLTGKIQYKDWSYIDKFELSFNDKGILIYNSYELRIDYKKK